MSEDRDTDIEQAGGSESDPVGQTADTPRPVAEQPADSRAAGEQPAEPGGDGSRGRARWGRRLTVALILLLVAGVAGAGWWAWDVSTMRSAARMQVDDATTLIENADVVVLDVDEVVRAEITPEIGERAADLIDSLDGAVADLELAAAMIGDVLNDLPEDEQPRAEALAAAARARMEMLSVSGEILEANAKAANALTPSLEGWNAVLEGEKRVDEAVVEYNKLTDASVRKAEEINVEAEKQFLSARALFSTAATAFPEADFSAYQTYIDGKIALIAISKQANAAYLRGDKAGANRLSEQYNVKDKELVEQSKQLPETPAEVVADAYEELAGASTEAYFEARDEATRADKILSDLEG